MKHCHYCNAPDRTHALRPYGPRGAMVCFACATATPERKRETERNMRAQLAAAGPGAMWGTDAGPIPQNAIRQ